MTDREPTSEVSLRDLDSKFEGLYDLYENPRIVYFDASEISVMREAMRNSGCRVEITPETKQQLMDTQIRNLDQGRGPALVGVLGDERSQKLLALIEDLSIDEPRFKNADGVPTEESRLRGHLQLAADLVSVAVLEEERDRDKILNRLNRRLWKGARKEAGKTGPIRDKLDTHFIENGYDEPDKLLARALPENVYPIWMAITGREIEP